MNLFWPIWTTRSRNWLRTSRRNPPGTGAPTGTEGMLVAYFSAEFGITECLTIFAGGLGMLAGDHLKSASDLGVPLVGVGLLYQQGYFRQYLNAAGWQQESYEDNDFQNLPLTSERRRRRTAADGGSGLRRPTGGRADLARAGGPRVALPAGHQHAGKPPRRPRHHRPALWRRTEMRLKQEILLGIGGYRALEALGMEPTVYHMNEGHSAFLSLERVRRLMERAALSFGEAREVASAGLVFTTHTPVPAGHDYFLRGLLDHYLGDYVRSLGLSPPGIPRAGPPEPPQRLRRVLHDRAGAAHGGLHQRRQQAARRGDAARCGRPSGPACRRTKSPSARSPTAFTSAPGFRTK